MRFSDDLNEHLEKVATLFASRGFAPPYIGVARTQLEDKVTERGLIKFVVDPDVLDMIYVIPHEFYYPQEKKKMNSLTILEIKDGVPVLLFEKDGESSVFDPVVIASILEDIYFATKAGGKKEAALRLATFLFSNIADLLDSTEEETLTIFEKEAE